MGEKQPYPRDIRLIRDYLTKLHQSTQQETTAALYFVWTLLLQDCGDIAIAKATEAGLHAPPEHRVAAFSL